MSGTISPAVADAVQLLRSDLYGHLDEAEFQAAKYTPWSERDVATARDLIPDLVLVIRGLLAQHDAYPDGVCQVCTSAWPCPVFSTIHQLLKDPDRQFVRLMSHARDAAGGWPAH